MQTNKLFFIAMTLLFGCFGCFGKSNRMPEGQLVSLQYCGYGTMKFPNFYYAIDCDNDGVTWLTHISDNGDTTRVVVGSGIRLKLRDAIQQSKLYKLKESYTSKLDVMDGDSWLFEATFKNDVGNDNTTIRRISSHGSNARPKNLSFGSVFFILDSVYTKIMSIPRPSGKLIEYKYEAYASMAQPYEAYHYKADLKKRANLHAYFYDVASASEINKDILIKDSTVEQIKDIVISHQMYAYDNHYPSPAGLLDGDSWILEFSFSSGESYTISGANNQPDDNAIHQINQLIKTLFLNEK